MLRDQACTFMMSYREMNGKEVSQVEEESIHVRDDVDTRYHCGGLRNEG